MDLLWMTLGMVRTIANKRVARYPARTLCQRVWYSAGGISLFQNTGSTLGQPSAELHKLLNLRNARVNLDALGDASRCDSRTRALPSLRAIICMLHFPNPMHVSTPQVSSPSFETFRSPNGVNFCRAIASKSLPWEPHDYQLDGACNALDRRDVLAITPTGSGKTGFLLVYMLVAQAIARDPTLCPQALRKHFKSDPCMLVICPTKALEHDMVSILQLKCIFWNF